MTNQRRLGRGLEALLSRPSGGAENDDPLAAARPALRVAEVGEPSETLATIAVELIDGNPFQPRQDFDETALKELADSIREHGLLQPLVVRRHGERYQVVAGERRLRAAIKAGWTEAPVQIREADDRQMAELAIVENLQRRDLNPLEKALSFHHYLERYGVTQSELAGRLKVDRSTVANLIRLLDLPEPVQRSLRSGAITQGHARALLPLGEDREQLALCERIQSEQLSVRAVEDLVQEMIHAQDAEPAGTIGLPGPAAAGGGLAASGVSPAAGSLSPAAKPGQGGAAARGKAGRGKTRSGHIASLEQEFRAALGAKVSIRQTAQGRGKIVIGFASNEEFERLRDLLCGPEVEVRG